MSLLSGYKTYIVLGGGIALMWLSILVGVDITCAIDKGIADPSCQAPDIGKAVEATWAAVAGIFLRKGIKSNGS